MWWKLIITLALGLLALPTALAARVVFICDLDSLLFEADTIIEAQIVDLDPPHRQFDDPLQTVKVLRSFLGEMKVGEQVDIESMPGRYRYSRDLPVGKLRTGDLKDGDRVILFLRHHISPSRHELIETGVRLIHRGQVYEFASKGLTGLLTRTPRNTTDCVLQTYESFCQKVEEGIKQAPVWRAFMEREATRENLPEFIECFRQRSAKLPPGYRRDVLMEKCASKMAQLLSASEIRSTLKLRNTFISREVLREGLDSQQKLPRN